PDAGEPPVRFGGRGKQTQLFLPTPIRISQGAPLLLCVSVVFPFRVLRVFRVFVVRLFLAATDGTAAESSGSGTPGTRARSRTWERIPSRGAPRSRPRRPATSRRCPAAWGRPCSRSRPTKTRRRRRRGSRRRKG